jgi:hypothetical protein
LCITAPPYATLSTIKLEFSTSIGASPIFFTLIVMAVPRGTSTKNAENTLKNAETAVGVTVIIVDETASPLIERANEIGAATPSAGKAILPPKETLNLALH